jgi:uncharacterized membrane protein YbhN (UPF0104 family)
MNKSMRKAVGRKRVIAASLVSLAILVVLACKTGIRLETVRDELMQANWAILAATFAASAAWHVFLGADKWWRILRALGAGVPFGEVLRVRLGSDPIRFAMPFKSGEIVGALYFGRWRQFGFSRAAGSIVFDKSLNLFGTLFWLYVGIAAMASLPATGYLVLHTAVGAAVLVLVYARPVRRAAALAAAAVHPKLGRFAEGVLSAFEEFSPLKKQLRPLFVCALLFIAFHPDRLPSLQEFLTYGSIVVLMSNVPLTVAGIGPRETTLALLFSEFAGQATLFSVGILMSLSIHVIPAILGIPLMIPLVRSLAVPAESLAIERGAGEEATAPPPGATVCPQAALELSPAADPARLAGQEEA